MAGAGSGEEARLAGLKLLWQSQTRNPQALLCAGRTISSPSASAATGSKVVSALVLLNLLTPRMLETGGLGEKMHLLAG